MRLQVEKYICKIKALKIYDRNVIASAAALSGDKLKDESLWGRWHNYTSKQGINFSQIVLPYACEIDRAELWNGVHAETLKEDGVAALEYELVLPEELNPEQQKALVLEFAQLIVTKYSIAADVTIHAAHSTGSNQCPHAHILATTRQIQPGSFCKKIKLFDSCKEDLPLVWKLMAKKAYLQAIYDHSQKELPDVKILLQAALKRWGVTTQPLKKEVLNIDLKPDNWGVMVQAQPPQGGLYPILQPVSTNRKTKKSRTTRLNFMPFIIIVIIVAAIFVFTILYILKLTV